MKDIIEKKVFEGKILELNLYTLKGSTYLICRNKKNILFNCIIFDFYNREVEYDFYDVFNEINDFDNFFDSFPLIKKEIALFIIENYSNLTPIDTSLFIKKYNEGFLRFFIKEYEVFM